MPASSVLIAGLARNCASHLQSSLERLAQVSLAFDAAKFVFVTNDSSDDTLGTLKRWALGRPEASVIEMDGLADVSRYRTARIALARNLYLLELRNELARGRAHEFLIVADLDGVNDQLQFGTDFGTVLRNAPKDWGGLFANQRTAYYDVWALRHPTWCPTDCWAAARSVYLPRFFRRRFMDPYHVWRKQVHIPADEPPIAVNSAFGGFGVYRTRFLERAWYWGLTRNLKQVCEHVAFNATVKLNGGQLYILPSLLNDAPAEHLGRGAGRSDRPWCRQG